MARVQGRSRIWGLWMLVGRLGGLGYAATGVDQSALALADGDPQQSRSIVVALLGGQVQPVR